MKQWCALYVFLYSYGNILDWQKLASTTWTHDVTKGIHTKTYPPINALRWTGHRKPRLVMVPTLSSLLTSGFSFTNTALISAWISNYTRYEVWDEITYPSSNFNGATVEVWEWISNFIGLFYNHRLHDIAAWIMKYNKLQVHVGCN